MANRKDRQGSGSQSIVRHPLFPTIVAFWFAALFGLGSLAVRTSLLESLIIASKIDLIVPQTAPPLGITARILIALGMAAIGSVAGFVMALRLARPHPEKQERVRTFGATGSAARTAPVDEPERRRALIASNDASSESLFDDGPSFLTGLSPHILDVTEFDVDPIDQQSVEPEPAVQAAPALELDQYAALAPVPAPGFQSFAAPQAAAEPAAAQEAQAPQQAGFSEPWQPMPVEPIEHQADPEPADQRAFAAPAAVEPAVEPAAMQFSAPVRPAEASYQEPTMPEIAPEAQAEYAPQAFVAPVTSPLQFSVGGPASAAARAAEPAEPSAAPAEPAVVEETNSAIDPEIGPEVGPEIGEVAGGADDTDPLAMFRNRAAPMPVFDDEPEVAYDGEPAEPAIHETFAAAPEPVAQAEPVADPLPAPLQPAVPVSAAAERLMNAELSDLSPVELIERLALSLQRKGQAVTLSQLPVAPAAPAPFAFAEPEPEAEPEPVASVAEVPDVELPDAELADADLPDAELSAAPADEREAHPRFTLPAAMRPIDFSQYEHEEALPDYVPARSIALPAEAEAPQHHEPEFRPPAQFAAPQDGPATPRFGRPAEEPVAQPEDEDLEAGYSSLLNMSRPAGQRQQYVRVNDPEADTEAAEPVVIFPGQAMRAGTQFAAPSEGPLVAPAAAPASLGDTSLQPRRFDAPAQGQSGPARNPEETERALRSALSTLQRMSGAA